ncbi:hypothetical protein L3X38_010708 [Prunus dulcis]|uniref:Uncharacterized protein n=1 Tax=Prunus dulcis TaxID=3755 RepID=A0AAD4ZDK7_PRUDU|nr:hypothetical protein L3X38_010708 [Prunus dulcis]
MPIDGSFRGNSRSRVWDLCVGRVQGQVRIRGRVRVRILVLIMYLQELSYLIGQFDEVQLTRRGRIRGATFMVEEKNFIPHDSSDVLKK